MSKRAAIIFENSIDKDIVNYCNNIIKTNNADVGITINPPSDADKYDAVIFVFENEYSDTNEKMCAVVGHQHLRAVWGENKKDMLKSEILHIAGIPKPYEIERKFLIDYPNTAEIEKMPNCQKADIEQMYLKEENGVRARIRRRTINGISAYILTEKKYVSAMKRIEIEKEITKDEYETLAAKVEDGCAAIEKSRYCLMHGGKYFEIDVFPFWHDEAYAEIELCREDEEFALPPFIKVIKEVTDDKNYTNRSLAKMLGGSSPWI